MAELSIDQILEELTKDDGSGEKAVYMEDMKRLLRDERTEEVRDFSFIEILNLESDEISVSKVLAFLLDPKNDSRNPMFIRLLMEKCGVSNVYDFSDTAVFTEKNTDKGQRIDILAVSDGCFMLLIENKIWSSEHGENGDQTIAYYDYCEERYDGCDCRVYIYLKPYKNGSRPSANRKYGNGGDNPYKVLIYDDIIDVLKEVVSTDGHRYNYKVIAEQFLTYCRLHLGKESAMGRINKECEAYIDNMEKFDIVENNISRYKNSYMGWIGEIKKNVYLRLKEYEENSRGHYITEFYVRYNYYWAHMYNHNEYNEKCNGKFQFYAEIHFCGDSGSKGKNDMDVVIESVVKKIDNGDYQRIRKANSNVPDCYKRERKDEINEDAASIATKYIVYDITPVKIDDLIKDGGDTEKIGERIFNRFKEYREGRANEIFKAFKEGYDSET